METWALIRDRQDELHVMPGGIRLEVVEPPEQHIPPSHYGIGGAFGTCLDTPRLKMTWPLPSMVDSLGDSWSGLYEMLQDLFREDLGSQLIEVSWCSTEMELVFELPHPQAVDELGLPNLCGDPREFCIKFAETFLGLVAKRKILEALEAKSTQESGSLI